MDISYLRSIGVPCAVAESQPQSLDSGPKGAPGVGTPPKTKQTQSAPKAKQKQSAPAFAGQSKAAAEMVLAETCKALAERADGDRDIEAERQEFGYLHRWPEWSRQHPAKDDVVYVHAGVRAGPLPRQAGSLSLVSWNVFSAAALARAQAGGREGKYAEAPKGSGFKSWGYPYVGEEVGSWDFRAARILEMLSSLMPDIILLQEVDKENAASIAGPLKKLGYDNFYHSYGMMTLWRSAFLAMTWENHKGSRSLITGLRLEQGSARGAEVVVVNVHLTAGAREEDFVTRAGQLHNTLARARPAKGTASVILAGDFNSDPASALGEVLRNHHWHGFDFASAYEHPAAASTSPIQFGSFAGDGARFTLDHVYYEHRCFRLKCLLEPLVEPARSAALGEGSLGIPDTNVPSDHIPVGVVLQML